MSRDSSGNYTLPAGNPVVAGTTITDTWGNTTMNDIATALTDSLSRSGKGGMSAALIGINGSAAAPGFAFSSESNSGMFRATGGVSIAGLGVLIATFISTAITFVKQLTVNVASDTIQSIVKGHSTQTSDLMQWQNSAGTALAAVEGTGAFYGVKPFKITKITTGSGNFSKDSKSRYIRIRMQGGGGQGGGAPATAAGQVSVGSGGAAGGYLEVWYASSALAATEAYSVGAGGTGAAAGAAGNAGATTTFRAAGATQMIAAGGLGGAASGVAANITGVIGASGSANTTGTGAIEQFSLAGNPGLAGFAAIVSGTNRSIGGSGGVAPLGGGSKNATANSAGDNAIRGSGGGGAANNESQAARSGGNGGEGYIIFEEFY